MATKAELETENSALKHRLAQRSRQVQRAEKKAAKANEALREFRVAYDQLAMSYRIAMLRLNSGEANALRAENAEEKLLIVREVIGIGGHVLGDDDRHTFHDHKPEGRAGFRYLPVQQGTVPQ